MAQPPGVSYLGMKNSPLALEDANLSKILRETVPKLVKFAQFAIAEEHLGDNRGNEFEIVMADQDPTVDMLLRTVKDGMDPLKTTDLKFAAHRFKSREFGLAIKFNISDVQMSQFNLESYTRDVLSRDVAKVRDSLCRQEMDLTPYQYIPYNDGAGACADLDSYYCDAVRDSPQDFDPVNAPTLAAYFADAALRDLPPLRLDAAGTIIPTQHYGWGSELIQFPGNDPELKDRLTPRAYVTSPLFVGVSVQSAHHGEAWIVVPGPLENRLGVRAPLFLDRLDPALSVADVLDGETYRIPKLNIHHVRNMVGYALRLNMLPYERMRVGSTVHEGFVLIAPSIQVHNLIDSLSVYNQLQLKAGDVGGGGGWAPVSKRDLEDLPSIAGAMFKLPGLAVPVLVVVDDYATTRMYNSYNQTFPWHDDNPQRIEPANYWLQEGRTIMGATLVVSEVPVPPVLNDDQLTETVQHLRAFAATEMCLREDPLGAVNAVHFYVQRRLPDGYGPCYLFGRDCITELVNQPWSLRKDIEQDFKRLSGYGWVMRTGYKNNWVPTVQNKTTPGMPFSPVRIRGAYNLVTPLDGGTGIYPPVKNYYKQNKIVKFNFPTWVAPHGMVDERPERFGGGGGEGKEA